MDRRYCTDRFSRVKGQWTLWRVFIAVAILCLLLSVINQLLFRAELTDSLGTIFLSEILLALIASPYFSSRALADRFYDASSDDLATLSRMRTGGTFGPIVAGSQVPLICFVVLSASVFAIFDKSSRDVSTTVLLPYHAALLATVFSSALVGMLGWRIFCNEIHAVQFAYAMSLLMVGGVFLLSPLDRYIGTLTIAGRISIIPVFLSINPLIAVCQLLEIDIFRAPNLYELTPLPSYLYVYPKWYIVCAVQVLVGFCCLLVVSRLGFVNDIGKEKA